MKNKDKWYTIPKKCLNCGKDFMGSKYRDQRFCSRLCGNNTNKTCFQPNHKTSNTGRTHFTRERVAGEKNNHWNNGISKFRDKIRALEQYCKWRYNIFQRDNWTCQFCQIRGVPLHAHHIDSFSSITRRNNIKNVDDAIKCAELWDENNGVTLCLKCHTKTDNYGRKIQK